MKKLALASLLAVSLTACGGGSTFGYSVTAQMIDIATQACLPNGGLNLMSAGTESETAGYRRYRYFEIVSFTCNNGLHGVKRTGRQQ